MHSGGDKKNAQKHANVINSPLIKAPDETHVLDVFPPAQLHMFMGATNSPIDLLIKVYGVERVERVERVEEWLRKVNVLHHGYHGGSMDGNNWKRLLDQIDAFAQLVPHKMAPFIAVLRALRVVAQGRIEYYECI